MATATIKRTTTQIPTDQPTATPTETATSTGPPVVAAPGKCPPFDITGGDDDVKRIVCTDAVGPEASMWIRPSKISLQLPGQITFTLVNDSAGPFGTTFYGWDIRKHVGDRWYKIAPAFAKTQGNGLGSGDRHTWRVKMNNDAVNGHKPIPCSSGDSTVTVPALGPGQYAFTISGHFFEADPENYETG